MDLNERSYLRPMRAESQRIVGVGYLEGLGSGIEPNVHIAHFIFNIRFAHQAFKPGCVARSIHELVYR